MRARGEPELRTVGELDKALQEAVEDRWWDGAPKSHAADLLSGVFMPARFLVFRET